MSGPPRPGHLPSSRSGTGPRVERDPWARTTIPAHLAKGAGLRLARRPGWTRLTSEPAPEFRRVGGARLGTVDVAHWLVCVNGRAAVRAPGVPGDGPARVAVAAVGATVRRREAGRRQVRVTR